MSQIDDCEGAAALRDYLVNVGDMSEAEAVSKLAKLTGKSEAELLVQAKERMDWSSEDLHAHLKHLT